ncbi:MAG: hypothetical protein Barrevirus3_18 [Barrevirus sp.]|uniref:Uncharacterized protein n=1 Tax=Barrevirus sp. TaxID=2487763 RepID=A0A3G4ZPS2_9VIRU|nr:MAG: hypothetical protein Barrevirus3_18 [Barrevirus sp.]
MDFSNNSNNSIIHNQQSDDIDVLAEQERYMDYDNKVRLEKFDTTVSGQGQEQESEKYSFMAFLNKYKFWIISIIILLFLIFLAYKNYYMSVKPGLIEPKIATVGGSSNLFELLKMPYQKGLANTSSVQSDLVNLSE